MNDESQLTDEQLRLATSRALPAGARLTSDTAAARESFLSVGATAEAAADKFDEAALLARLQQSCLPAPVVTLQPTKPHRDWLSFVLTGALAAAALIAIVRIATDSSGNVQPIAALPGSPAFMEPEPANASQQLALPWNDPLDDEIALASATIQQYSTRDRGFDGSLLDMNDRLEALSQELLNDTL